VGERERVDDDVRGRTAKGGWSQANYQRSVDDDADHHLRHVAGELFALWQTEPFTRLVLGGPAQDVDTFAALLNNELRPALSPARLGLEAETATVADVRAALGPIIGQERSAAKDAALGELTEHLARASGAVTGVAGTLEALAERRVKTLVLGIGFAAAGVRCPSCGLLYPEGTDPCPADGTPVEPIGDLREAAVQAAVLQDATVFVIGEGSEIGPEPLLRGGGIAALLRF
jgi:peptide chain release factor subunit 1